MTELGPEARRALKIAAERLGIDHPIEAFGIEHDGTVRAWRVIVVGDGRRAEYNADAAPESTVAFSEVIVADADVIERG